MIDPENVLIRCPNGHELQAARADLDKPLACPLCKVTFTPGAAAAPPAPAAPPPTPEPVTMSYAGEVLTRPIKYPPYTNWMLGLWVGTAIVTAIFAFYQLVNPTAFDPTQPGLGPLILVGFVGCAILLAFVAAVVFQLMWIYRVHADAHRVRDYTDVSPGLALGLSFIPVFNLAWTGWLIRKLARFVARSSDSAGPLARRAVDSAGICFIAGIIMAAAYCVNLGIQFWLMAEARNLMGQMGAEPDMAELQRKLSEKIPMAWQVLSPIIPLVGTLVYFRTVRRLEAVLYPFLGAPDR